MFSVSSNMFLLVMYFIGTYQVTSTADHTPVFETSKAPPQLGVVVSKDNKIIRTKQISVKNLHNTL